MKLHELFSFRIFEGHTRSAETEWRERLYVAENKHPSLVRLARAMILRIMDFMSVVSTRRV